MIYKAILYCIIQYLLQNFGVLCDDIISYDTILYHTSCYDIVIRYRFILHNTILYLAIISCLMLQYQVMPRLSELSNL